MSGARSGYVLDEAVHRGWQAHGVDASPFARSRAEARGHVVSASMAAALTADRAGTRPDVVTFFQVLEHIVDAHRYGVLGRAAERVALAVRLTNVVIPYRLGDLVTLVAIKP